jgi:hypothetical protein
MHLEVPQGLGGGRFGRAGSGAALAILPLPFFGISLPQDRCY